MPVRYNVDMESDMALVNVLCSNETLHCDQATEIALVVKHTCAALKS